MLATTLSGTIDAPVQAALARLAELEQPHWSGDLRFLRRWAEATCLSAAGRYEALLARGASWPEDSIAALAFGAADVQAETS